MGRRELSVEIAADPGRVYDFVAAVDQVPDLSPEVRRVEWLGDVHRPEPGARFRGWNRWHGFGWSREVLITQAERGRTFAFETMPGRRIYNVTTRWLYVFEPTSAGTRVTESYEYDAPTWLRWMHTVMGRPRALARGMTETLARLKVVTEAER